MTPDTSVPSVGTGRGGIVARNAVAHSAVIVAAVAITAAFPNSGAPVLTRIGIVAMGLIAVLFAAQAVMYLSIGYRLNAAACTFATLGAVAEFVNLSLHGLHFVELGFVVIALFLGTVITFGIGLRRQRRLLKSS